MIKFGIIGCGSIANRHSAIIEKVGRLVAVCDIILEKAVALSKIHFANYYLSTTEMLKCEKDLDVVVVCSPNGLHVNHCIEALKAGYHVLCEKPMAIKKADCIHMIQAAELSQKKLFIVKQNRFNPPVEAVKKLLDSKALGKIYNIQLNCFWNRNIDYYTNTWKGTLELDGGILYTQFSHFIDLILWMFGPINTIQGYAGNQNRNLHIQFEDTIVLSTVFDSGVLGNLHFSINSYLQNVEGSLTILAEKGTVKIGGQYLNTLEYQHIKDVTIQSISQGNPSNDYGYYQGSMSNHDKVYDNLIDVLKFNSKIAASAEDGLRTVELIEEIYHIIRKN